MEIFFLTGDVGWGIAWYINGVLIPEITVERGKSYTFIVEGGNDPENAARSHPFYITDDPEGGYEFKTEAEKKVSNLSNISCDFRSFVLFQNVMRSVKVVHNPRVLN